MGCAIQTQTAPAPEAAPMSDKPKFPAATALAVASELCAVLRPATDRLIVAGSLRRRKPMVGDVEILFIPKLFEVQDGLFDVVVRSAADEVLQKLINDGRLAMRTNVNGSTMWGTKNKLAVHVASGVPVDLFTATAENWFNYLVCRTGPADSNTRICMAAQARAWKWNPYGAGFSREAFATGPEAEYKVTSERDVFEFVGLPYAEPWERA